MFVVAVAGVENLAREKKNIEGDFNLHAVKYFDIAKRYCLNAQDYRLLLEKFD